MTKGDKAKQLFENGYNCAQAVFCSFPEVTGLDNETALRISAGLGGGMGRMREVCGAVSGMIMVISSAYACTDPSDHTKKAELYALIQKAAGEFREENGSIICRELLGLAEKVSDPVPEKRTNTYYHKRPCGEIVKCAADITEKYVNKK